MPKVVKNSAKTLLLAFTCVALATTAQGEIDKEAAGGQVYNRIPTRNIFGLGNDDPHDHEYSRPTPPPTNAKLTGITTVLGHKQAFFIVSEPAADGKAVKPHSAMLCEGESFAKLEVLQINPEARTVKVKNDGIESVISLSAGEARK